jgi:hypothetical protein
MRRTLVLLLAVLIGVLGLAAPALADGPSGSTECHLADDDCDGAIDEDPANGLDDDGDGAVDEDAAGDAADDPGENQVDCNEASSTNVGGLNYLYAGTNGAEACADETSALPVDGRATATTDQGGYVAVDGDNSNTAPANGYARVDSGGVHCGDEVNQDSSATDQSGNTPQDCG